MLIIAVINDKRRGKKDQYYKILITSGIRQPSAYTCMSKNIFNVGHILSINCPETIILMCPCKESVTQIKTNFDGKYVSLCLAGAKILISPWGAFCGAGRCGARRQIGKGQMEPSFQV